MSRLAGVDAEGRRRQINATRFVEAIPKSHLRPGYGTPSLDNDGQAFLVWLTQNGGANGDDGSTTTAAFATFTYDVFSDSAKTIQIGTAVAVEFHRLLKVAVTPAAKGLAQWAGNTLYLLQVDEYFDRDAC